MSWACAADQNKKVRLLEVSKAKSSPFGLLSTLALGGAVATGEQSSLHNLASMLLAGQLQKAAFQNGVTSNGATMAVMPDIQVSMIGIDIMGFLHLQLIPCTCSIVACVMLTVGLATAVQTHSITAG